MKVVQLYTWCGQQSPLPEERAAVPQASAAVEDPSGSSLPAGVDRATVGRMVSTFGADATDSLLCWERQALSTLLSAQTPVPKTPLAAFRSTTDACNTAWQAAHRLRKQAADLTNALSTGRTKVTTLERQHAEVQTRLATAEAEHRRLYEEAQSLQLPQGPTLSAAPSIADTISLSAMDPGQLQLHEARAAAMLDAIRLRRAELEANEAQAAETATEATARSAAGARAQALAQETTARQ